jgi:riboflavin-specific deaminase-like protein
VTLFAAPELGEAKAWSLVRAFARRARRREPVNARTWFAFTPSGEAEPVAPELGSLWIEPGADPCFGTREPMTAAAERLFTLYLPLCVGDAARALVLAHLAQSLDGQVATSSGASRYLTGASNLVHTHRLRALSDAVVVGAGTAEQDDPQLTTRLVPGENPVRVVIDPRLRVSGARRVFTDGAAPTLVVCAAGVACGRGSSPAVELVEVPSENGLLSPAAIVAALRRRGLWRLFIEGGGVTVSRFLRARLLHRLQVTIAPVILGVGRQGIGMPAIDAIEHALRPRARRFELGEDVMFDCELEAP